MDGLNQSDLYLDALLIGTRPASPDRCGDPSVLTMHSSWWEDLRRLISARGFSIIGEAVSRVFPVGSVDRGTTDGKSPYVGSRPDTTIFSYIKRVMPRLSPVEGIGLSRI